MDTYKRHLKLWRIILPACSLFARAFRLDYEPIRVDGPMVLVVNHVTACDPLLMGAALGRKHVYYVASDHILRQNSLGRFLRWAVAPIARRKGAPALVTVKECLRHLRAGHSVCIFAEGEQSWDGRAIPVVDGTGTLLKAAGVSLVTYRLEGGYLSLPRWGRGLRRGRMRGRVTGIYGPEELAALSKEEINRLLNEGIRENAWERQRQEAVPFRGKRRAEGLETCLYLCPGCHRVGTLKSKGDRLFCGCGFEMRFSETGFFVPAAPFPTVAEWEDWQKERLRRRDFLSDTQDGALFADNEACLSEIDGENRLLNTWRGELRQWEDRIACAGHSFFLRDIREMAMTRADRLLFSTGSKYFQIRGGGSVNLRKYLEIWKQQNGEGER